MKKFTFIFLLSCFLLISICSAAYADVSIIYKGNVLNTRAPIITENGQNLFPVEEFFSSIGIEVEKDNIFKRLTVRIPQKTVVIKPSEGKVWVNGVEKMLYTQPKEINKSTYLPLSFLSDGLGYVLDYKESPIGQFVYLYDTTKKEFNGLKNVLKIPRKTPQVITHGIDPVMQNKDYFRWVINHKAYLLSGNGNLLEIASLGKEVQLRNIDQTLGLFTIQEKETKKNFTYLGNVETQKEQFLVTMNGQDQDNKYIGVGLPANNREIRRVSTLSGNYRLYSGIEEFDSIYLDKMTGKITGSGKDVRKGYVLDIQESIYADKTGNWAMADDSSYAFTINSQIIIFDKELKPRFEEKFNTNVTDNAIASVNNKFLVLHVVKENNRNNRLYGMVTDNWGNVFRPYNLLKIFDESETLKIEKCVSDGPNVLFVLKTSNGRYVGSFNMNNLEVNISPLIAGEIFRQLIPGPSGYYLFGYDDDYFYLSPANNYF